jgi:DNA polymerase-1
MRDENLDFRIFRQVLQYILDTKTVIYFNAKFDIVSLGTLGLDARHRKFMDCMVLCHLINENTPKAKSLDACAKHYLHNEGKRISSEYEMCLKLWGYENLPASVTCEYAMIDAVLTYELFHAIKAKLNAEKLGETWQHKMKFTEKLIDMESRGVGIDIALCNEMACKGNVEMEHIQHSLNGLCPSRPADLYELLVDRLGLPVLHYTKQHKPSFDKHAMEDYDLILQRTNNPLARQVKTYRGWQKSVSSNYEPYMSLLSPDGRLRASYKLHGTVTGRMSCEKPNLQQIPRAGDKPWNGTMKQCFIPREGYRLIEGDYSQLEFRMGAGFSKEQVLIDIFSDRERDVFSEMAESLKMPRYSAKTLNYAVSYGAQVARLMLIFGVSEREAWKILNDYHALYPRMKKASEYAKNYAEHHGDLPLWSGRKRHFEYPKSEGHKAWNSFIQGGAADVVERTMLRASDEGFDTDDCSMLLQVHDSIVWEVREDLVDTLKPELQHCMEAVPGNFNVPFHADIHEWSK